MVSGVGLVIGSWLGQSAILAVLGLFVLGLGAAWAADRGRAGRLGLQIAFPLTGIGLSFAFPASAAFAGLMILSGAYAWMVSLLWPVRTLDVQEAARHPSEQIGIGYGIRLGSAGATAAAVGFAFGLDHKGWVCAAALMVMRPATEALVARGVGRALSVLIGALLGAWFMLGSPDPIVVAGSVGLVLAAMAATQASRWYVTPAFTTFVVLVLLLWHNPSDAQWRFLQRTLETVLGVVIALLFGVLLPVITRWVGASRSTR